jgi:hypothetical protein
MRGAALAYSTSDNVDELIFEHRHKAHVGVYWIGHTCAR